MSATFSEGIAHETDISFEVIIAGGFQVLSEDQPLLHYSVLPILQHAR